MFDQNQISEFKDVRCIHVHFCFVHTQIFQLLVTLQAFNLIDQNHDDFIDKEDLKIILNSLGTFFCW